MKFTCFVDINLPRERVVELFDNPDNIPKWQDGFQGFKHLNGEPGTPGAQSMIYYQQGKRTMELLETIIVGNLPEEFTAKYEHKHMTNTMQVLFTSLDAQTTRYTSNIEYTKFNGFLPKLMAFLFPSMFKKQVQKWLDQFKTFAENEG